MGSHLLPNGLPLGTEANDEVLSMAFTQEMFVNGFRPYPFENELERIRYIMKCLEQRHIQKKVDILPQYEKEMENIRRKYDLLLNIEDATFQKKKTVRTELTQKVERGISVDKELTALFGEKLELYTSGQDHIAEQLSEFIVAQAPPTDNVEVFSLNSIAGSSSQTYCRATHQHLCLRLHLAETLRVSLQDTLVHEILSCLRIGLTG